MAPPSASLMKPSEVFDEPWVWAHRGHGDYPPDTDRGGKWLVYVGEEYVDRAWESIRAATEAGWLGSSAKAATSFETRTRPVGAQRSYASTRTTGWMRRTSCVSERSFGRGAR